MTIKDVEFVASFPKESACPKDGRPEFAFIGRSNVGKSSLINMLTNKKGLAKVSVTPGKTQLLNFFEINNKWYLVDLPGYGYARASKDKKDTFSKMIRGYLEMRTTLYIAFVLIDIRHPLQKIDQEFLEWCGEKSVPYAIIFTKADKLGKKQIHENVKFIVDELLIPSHELPPYFISSSETKQGKDEILAYIDSILKADLTQISEPIL
ncbi:MAG: YihA family ribosome biogenesis GTP-binding protein [Saprospiraceae bacterium]|nr:YihA family ribosome biogenesis GTP-binding protein [Saprospiraceae bacterium]